MAAELTLNVEVIEDEPIPDPGTQAILAAVVRAALEAEGQVGAWDVTVALMSDDALRRLHLDFLGVDSATDIMTFPRGEGELGGDIAISVERAASQASEYGHGAWEEVRFLTVHGALHLCGWDDGDDEARGRMLARQGEIIAGFERRGGEPA